MQIRQHVYPQTGRAPAGADTEKSASACKTTLIKQGLNMPPKNGCNFKFEEPGKYTLIYADPPWIPPTTAPAGQNTSTP